jgi:hypothetical protein
VQTGPFESGDPDGSKGIRRPPIPSATIAGTSDWCACSRRLAGVGGALRSLAFGVADSEAHGRR